MQAQACYPGEMVIEGEANDATQKVEFDHLDRNGKPVNPRVVNKTPAEIAADTPPPVDPRDRSAGITRRQWNDVLERLTALES